VVIKQSNLKGNQLFYKVINFLIS